MIDSCSDELMMQRRVDRVVVLESGLLWRGEGGSGMMRGKG